MLFEIELPPGETVKMVRDDKNIPSMLTIFRELRVLRETLKTEIVTNPELKYVSEKVNYARSGYYILANGKDILEHYYGNNVSRNGLYISDFIKDVPPYGRFINFKYKDPIPSKKFDSINYYNIKDGGRPTDPDFKFVDRSDEIIVPIPGFTTRLDGNLYHLHHIDKYLNIGGSAFFSVLAGRPSEGTLAFPYLLKSFFKQVVVSVSGYCVGIYYNGTHLKESGFPSIPLASIKPFVTFATNIYKEANLIHTLLLKPNKSDFFNRLSANTVDMRLAMGMPLTKAEQDFVIFTLQEFKKDPYDYKKRITAAVNTEEGMFLYKKIIELRAKKIAEVGLATGVSTAYLLIGAKETNGHVISIDPFQDTQWKNAGLDLVEHLRLKSRHTWIKEKSHTALPRLLDEKGAESSYDLIFIDGWHTFDYTLVDAYFADKLLRVGGIMIVDDFLHRGVNASMRYITTNWSHYKKLHSPNSFAAFIKLREDDRDWDFHKTF